MDCYSEAIIMSFRDRMNVARSKAEEQVDARLTREGLVEGALRNRQIPLSYDAEGRERWTEPDFCWITRRVALYLDGEKVHSSRGARLRDERITGELEGRGWVVMRISHGGKLSEVQLDELVKTLRGLVE